MGCAHGFRHCCSRRYRGNQSSACIVSSLPMGHPLERPFIAICSAALCSPRWICLSPANNRVRDPSPDQADKRSGEAKTLTSKGGEALAPRNTPLRDAHLRSVTSEAAKNAYALPIPRESDVAIMKSDRSCCWRLSDGFSCFSLPSWPFSA